MKKSVTTRPSRTSRFRTHASLLPFLPVLPLSMAASLFLSTQEAPANEAQEATQEQAEEKLAMVPFEEYSPDAYKLAQDLKDMVVESSLDFARDPRLAAPYYLGLWEQGNALNITIEFTDTDTLMEAIVTVVEMGGEESEFERRVFSCDMEMDPHPGVWIPVDIAVGEVKKEG